MLYSIYRFLEIDGIALFLFLSIAMYGMFGAKGDQKAGFRFFASGIITYAILYYGTYLLPFTSKPHHYWYYFLLNLVIALLMSHFLLPGDLAGKFLYILFNLSFIQLYKMACSPLYEAENRLNRSVYAALDILSITILLLLLIFFYGLFKPSIPKIQRNLGRNIFLLAYFPIGLLIFYGLELLGIPFVSRYSEAMLAIIILPALPILYNLFITIVNSYEEQRILDRALTETKAQVYRYRYSLELDERIKKERHELKNNYLYIQTLLADKKYDEIEKYLEETIGLKMNALSEVSTGNTMIDYVINRKISEVRKKDIKIYTEVMLPKDISIDEEKFCTVFLNLFNNAAEACSTVVSPDIHIALKCVRNYLCCEIKNKADIELINSNPGLRTTKADNKNHGFGLKIVKETLNECDGLFSTATEGNYFISKFMIPLLK